MNYKSFVLPILGATLVAGLVRYYFPKVETKTVTVTRTVVQRDVRTVTRIVERPDGTRETIIDAVDRSTEEKDKSKIAIKYKEPQWRVGLLVLKDFRSKFSTTPARDVPAFGLEVQRKIVGPIYVGVQYAEAHLGAQIGMEF